ncbi:MAG: hypothetical protein JNN01_03235, partial [Opitutaceae bacterium]|nr:hypothetical protein [Opitutaceae bacterium]
KALGFRMLMDVISLDASLVRGSHGACPADSRDWPVLIGAGEHPDGATVSAVEVHDRLVRACLREPGSAA